MIWRRKYIDYIKKKIVFITTAISGGGAERVMSILANEFVKKNYQVKIVFTISNDIEYELDSHVQMVKCESVLKNSTMNQIKMIRKILKNEQPCTVISFFTHQNIYTIMSNFGLKNTVIVSERNDPRKTGKNFAIRKVRNVIYNFADALVFQTLDAKNYFSKRIQNKGVVIPNPIKEDLPELYVGERDNRLVAFSRLSSQKNIPMMLDACKMVFDRHPEYILEIYGVGEEKDKLKQYIKEIGVSEKVHFMGFLSDVHSRIRTATAFLSSSDYEGISNSMLEALAIGLPCVCTDCPIGGARMFIKSYKNGILVPVGDKFAMSNAILYMIEHKYELDTFSSEGTKIKEVLSVTNIVSEWEKII